MAKDNKNRNSKPEQTDEQSPITVRFPRDSEIISRFEKISRSKGFSSLNNSILAVLDKYMDVWSKSQENSAAA